MLATTWYGKFNSWTCDSYPWLKSLLEDNNSDLLIAYPNLYDSLVKSCFLFPRMAYFLNYLKLPVAIITPTDRTHSELIKEQVSTFIRSNPYFDATERRPIFDKINKKEQYGLVMYIDQAPLSQTNTIQTIRAYSANIKHLPRVVNDLLDQSIIHNFIYTCPDCHEQIVLIPSLDSCPFCSRLLHPALLFTGGKWEAETVNTDEGNDSKYIQAYLLEGD